MFEDPVLAAHVKQVVLDLLAFLIYLIRTRNPRGFGRRKSDG